MDRRHAPDRGALHPRGGAGRRPGRHARPLRRDAPGCGSGGDVPGRRLVGHARRTRHRRGRRSGAVALAAGARSSRIFQEEPLFEVRDSWLVSAPACTRGAARVLWFEQEQFVGWRPRFRSWWASRGTPKTLMVDGTPAAPFVTASGGRGEPSLNEWG